MIYDMIYSPAIG